MIECIQEEGDFTDWEVPSSSSDIKYIVSVDDEGNLFCSCHDFYYRKSRMNPHISNPESYCKHIRQVLEHLQSIVLLQDLSDVFAIGFRV